MTDERQVEMFTAPVEPERTCATCAKFSVVDGIPRCADDEEGRAAFPRYPGPDKKRCTYWSKRS